MSTLKEKLSEYAKNNYNVMLIGTHGIGKSTVVMEVAEQLGLKFKYYSTPTLDPFAELIGVPVPNKENKTIEFYRPHDLDDAEFVFFDELNRVTNTRILNTVHEIIQFKSINGVPLKNLKMIWAAINPPGDDYLVEDLDPALQDRFHFYVKMKANIDLPYMKEKMREQVARVVKQWWDDDLDANQRKILTPRRIEYIGDMINKGVPWKDALPPGHSFPDNSLNSRIRIINNEIDDIILSKEYILENVDDVIEKLGKDARIAIKVAGLMKRFNQKELFNCRNIVELLPKELVFTIGDRKFSMWKREFLKLFEDAKIDVNNYPKITEAFNFQDK